MVDKAVDNKVDKGKPNGRKQSLLEVLKEMDIIQEGFTGKIVLEMDVNQGGIRSLDYNRKQRMNKF